MDVSRKTRTVNIAFVSNVVYPYVKGGAQKRIHEIGRRLAADGHDVTVYGRHYWDGPRVIESAGMTLQAVAPEADLYAGERRSIPEAIDFAARALPSLRSLLPAREHDLVVASVFPYFPVLSTKLATLGLDVPVVTTWHEVWRDYWEEYLGPLAFGGKLAEYATARVPQLPVAVSGVTADRLAGIGPDRDRIRVVPNGLDTEQVRSAPLPNDPAEGYDVLFAGRLIEHKNVDVLLDAFDSVATRHDATLGIVGDGPEADALRRRAEGLDASDRIDFLGFLDEYEDVLGHMRVADIFASPSTREGFGITFAEAMAAGCTVIGATHPHSAADEVIGDAGFLAEPNTGAVAAALDRALGGERPDTDPQERADRYDWSSVATQAERTYERAIDGDW
ncbi:Glycosyltransferase involved in cell wall bisynthesis [Halorientalis persicus]|uniref:Glycosyltransferase involved in cell wall bisynthesis n=1 Tax=Halorientalis persicus TaxID=1367881 RepID=A0A1H8SXV6_9EURY|nr:glycosyltransferase family 4 protein [Halorientalis persicus]SEO83522.1 Glycosyltransferase involved in cell wall bisynthesis [Halorientalis persicus]